MYSAIVPKKTTRVFPDNTLPTIIRNARSDLGLSARKLATQITEIHATLSRLETGHTRLVKSKFLAKLSKRLGIPQYRLQISAANLRIFLDAEKLGLTYPGGYELRDAPPGKMGR